MELSGSNNSSSQNNSGLSRHRSAPTSLLANSTPLNTQTAMKKGDHSCKNQGFSDMNPRLPPQYPRPDGGGRRGCCYTTVGMDCEGRGKVSSSLVRQNSSPAGLFSQINPQNGSRLFESRRAAEGGANRDPRESSSRFRNPMNPSPLGMLSRMSEVEPKVETISVEDSFSSFEYWSNEYSFSPENFNSQTGGESGSRPHMLGLHRSTLGGIGSVEKLLRFQETRVPCKSRAKRGCATHPRSIAERVRRTRISERIRKLHDLVPDMDKQINTADMLDFAVEYIKGLQKQYKALSEVRAKCKCSAFEVHLNQTS